MAQTPEVARVTGGSRGIGAASATELARAGGDGAIGSVASADCAGALSRNLGGKANALPLSAPANGSPAIGKVIKALGGLDILVARELTSQNPSHFQLAPATSDTPVVAPLPTGVATSM